MSFATLFAMGQSSVYKPFPTTYGSWVYRYYDDFHNPTSLETQYTLSGDTIISFMTYKKIFVNSNYKGALRESSKIVYFIPDTSTTEYLLYNFNLTTGDTLIHPFGGAICTNDTLSVSYVDSILLSDGFHKKFCFNPIAPCWIEGIGSEEYLLAPLQTLCLSGNDLLVCMTSDNIFHLPANQTTCILSVNEQQISSSDIIIFPNPFNDSFTVDFGNACIKEIIVTDLLGNRVLQQQPKNRKKIEIDLMTRGTYILTAIDKNGQKINRKIISSP